MRIPVFPTFWEFFPFLIFVGLIMWFSLHALLHIPPVTIYYHMSRVIIASLTV